MPASPPTFGIEVSSTKVYNKKEDKHHDAVQIKISPGLFIKGLSSWMKEYQVGKTLREWAKTVQWKEQVWQPLKDWHKSVDWKQVRSEIKEGMDEVDWKQARSEIKEGLDEVDWKQVRNEIKDGMAEVDWKDVKSQVKEATQDLDLQGALHEVRDSMKEVDWNQVHHDMKEAKKTIYWDEMKRDFSQGITDLLNDIKESVAHEVDWDDVTPTNQILQMKNEVECLSYHNVLVFDCFKVFNCYMFAYMLCSSEEVSCS